MFVIKRIDDPNILILSTKCTLPLILRIALNKLFIEVNIKDRPNRFKRTTPSSE